MRAGGRVVLRFGQRGRPRGASDSAHKSRRHSNDAVRCTQIKKTDPARRSSNAHQQHDGPQSGSRDVHTRKCRSSNAHEQHEGPTTVAPVMFGKPLLNNVLAFDHVQL